MSKIRTYQELLTYDTYDERLEYLKLSSKIGIETFGFDRWINQNFYRSKEWKDIRQFVIMRDNGCDLSLEGYDIYDRIIIHHMNPLSITDISEHSDYLFNPNYLVSVSHYTHNAIHYGLKSALPPVSLERKPNDTCPWRK